MKYSVEKDIPNEMNSREWIEQSGSNSSREKMYSVRREKSPYSLSVPQTILWCKQWNILCVCVCLTHKVDKNDGVPSHKISVDKENKTQLLCQAKETKSMWKIKKWKSLRDTVKYTKRDTLTHSHSPKKRNNNLQAKYLHSYIPVYLHANVIIFIHVLICGHIESERTKRRAIEIEIETERMT